MSNKTKEKKQAEEETAAAEETSALARYRFSDRPKEIYEIDPIDLTGEEQVMVEELFDQPWNILLAEGWITQSRKASIFFAFLARRRKEPTFTYEEALRFDPKYVREGEGDGEGGDRPTSASPGPEAEPSADSSDGGSQS